MSDSTKPRILFLVSGTTAHAKSRTTVGLLSGAAARLDAVEAGEADIAALSAGAAHDLAAADSGRLLPPLDPGTYYAPSTLAVANRPDPSERARIGIGPAPTAISSPPMRRQHPRRTTPRAVTGTTIETPD
ncbi:hypothetical protein ABZ687_29575 [Streptomyces ardesiacus]|uniref:hypothetical protein n=1 Tax=Streptomyces ardesiacus TaxID=285564 RepID=UPI0033F192E2